MKSAFVFLLMSGIMLVSVFAQNKKTAATAVSKSGASSLASSITSGKKIYIKYCLSCHQAQGNGVPNMNPPLIGTSYVLGNKDTLISIVLHGFKANVEINGQTYTNTMPAFNYLKDKEVADVLTYIRNSFTNKADAISPFEVAALRLPGKMQ